MIVNFNYRPHRMYLIPSVCVATDPRDFSKGSHWHVSFYFLMWRLRIDL
jgi:hypothetical protein